MQLDQSVLAALKTEIQAKAEIKGNLDTYKYYDNVSVLHWDAQQHVLMEVLHLARATMVYNSMQPCCDSGI